MHKQVAIAIKILQWKLNFTLDFEKFIKKRILLNVKHKGPFTWDKIDIE